MAHASVNARQMICANVVGARRRRGCPNCTLTGVLAREFPVIHQDHLLLAPLADAGRRDVDS